MNEYLTISSIVVFVFSLWIAHLIMRINGMKYAISELNSRIISLENCVRYLEREIVRLQENKEKSNEERL